MGDSGANQAPISDVRNEVCLITISYRGDFELAQDLCASIDRFADPQIEHVLVVPHSDVSLPLASGRRRLISKEEVLPNGYRRLPLPHQVVFGSLYRRLIREIWWGPTGLFRRWVGATDSKAVRPDDYPPGCNRLRRQ